MANWTTLVGARPRAEAQLYGVVDAAADDSLYERLTSEPEQSKVTCLFEGEPALRYCNVAPYLVRLHLASPLAAHWLHAGYRRHWGIWVSTPQPIVALKRHLKKFLFAQMADKRRAYLRYYDPRVLGQLLPAMTPGQCGDFFGLNHTAMPDAFFTADAAPLPTNAATPLCRYIARRGLLDRVAGSASVGITRFAWAQAGTT